MKLYFNFSKIKFVSLIELITSISILLLISVLLHEEYILPPFLATASTKYADKDWKINKQTTIVFSYLFAGIVAVIFSLFVYGIFYATIASFVCYLIELVLNIKHPPSLLVTFIGVLDHVKFTYIIKPVLIGIFIIEGISYILEYKIK